MIRPQLAKSGAGKLPNNYISLGRLGGWLYEVKWDGYRCIAVIQDGKVVLQSRSGKSDQNAQFPKVVEALAGLPDCILDGELVVLDSFGNSDFGRMDQKGEATYVVFDCLATMGMSIRNATLSTRKDAADALVNVLSSPRVVTSVGTTDGEALLRWAATQNIEGIVAKKLNSKYSEGSRNGDWLKIKLRQQQEFAVLGWIPGEGSRAGIAGSILLAVHDGKGFNYCGRVGTGGDLDQWRDLAREGTSGTLYKTAYNMNGASRAELRDVCWVDPFVVQVEFQRWTEDDHLWHPSLMGVRTDKEPHECRREA